MVNNHLQNLHLEEQLQLRSTSNENISTTAIYKQNVIFIKVSLKWKAATAPGNILKSRGLIQMPDAATFHFM